MNTKIQIMKKLLFFTLSSFLMITISSPVFAQTWDKKSIEKRRTEILYKLCNGGEMVQEDCSDLFEKGLLDILIKNISGPKDVEQINKMVDGSLKFYNFKCQMYFAKTDSAYNVYLQNTKADSIAIPVQKKRK
jgi:hypothetical protein